VDITRAALDGLVAHARRALPDECCGLLIGSAERIDEAVPARNLRASPNRYEIDPADHFAVIRRVRRERRAIVGAYHSHPASAAAPSPTDIAEAHDAELLHVIVSLRDPGRVDVRAYRIANETVREVRLVVVG
jgi:proteasome lid subunit RPN8/RPN11